MSAHLHLVEPPAPAPPSTPTIANPAATLKRRGRQLLLALGLAAVLTVALALVNILRQGAALEHEAFALLQLEARALEGQVSPVFDSTANSLRAIAAWTSMKAPRLDAAQMSAELRQQLPGLPFVRSISVLDGGGAVLASSEGRNVGRRVPIARLDTARADPSEPHLGPHLIVRDLADLADPDAPRVPGLAGSLPVLLKLSQPQGPRWLVALIAVDSLTNAHALIVANLPTSAALTDLRGRVIGHTGEVQAGRDLSALIPFAQRLPDREHGVYEGAGSEGGPVLAAFRAARRWPLVVLVERPRASIDAELRKTTIGSVTAAVAVLGLLGGLGWTARRSLRQEAQVLAEREATHAQVARTEERWKRALDAAGQFVWELDLVTATFTASPGLCRMLGYREVESHWTYDWWRQAVHPDDQPLATDCFLRHQRRELPVYLVEQRMRTASGQWVWVIVRGMITRWDATGQRALALSGVLADISARKASEQALIDSEARQQAILASALDGIITLEADGTVIGFNAAAERIFGYTASQIIGRRMSETLVPHHLRGDEGRGLAHLQRADGEPFLNRRVESQGLRADGTVIPIELAIVPVMTHPEVLFTATVRDISAEKRVQRDLQASEERFRGVFEQAAVGIVQSDPHGITQYANAAICTMLRCEPGHGGPRGLHDMLHPQDSEADPRMLYEMLRRGADSVSAECRLHRSDGQWVWTRITASLMRMGDGQPPVMLSIIEDISGRKRAEEQLVSARQRELDDGARIQRTLLSAQPDQRIPGLWIGAVSAASQVIDGDFVEVLKLGEGVVDIVVGDVMGKGVSAALFGAATKMAFSRCLATLLANPATRGALPAPATIVAGVHALMTPSLQALESFVTISYLRVNSSEGRITWVGCGSEEPLLVTDHGVATTLANQHPPLGVLTAVDYVDDSLPFRPSDVVFLASDGAADALLPDGSRLGRERINAMITGLLRASKAPANVLHAFRKGIDELGAAVVDDLTMVLAVGTDDLITASRRELSQGVDDIVHVRGLVGNRAAFCGLGETDASLFATACVEAYTNVLRHSTGRIADAPIEMVVRVDDEALVVEFVSVGDDVEVPEAPAEADLADYPEGGFGLAIMRSATDRVEYLHHQGINTVRLTRLRPTPAA